MLIALEGPDGAGKSTLAQQLLEQLPGSEVIHFSQLKRNPLDEYVFDIQDYSPTEGGHLILDRWFVGEDVYGPLYRTDSAVTPAQKRWLNLWGLSRGASLWHVTQPIERLQQRLDERGEEFLKPEHVVHAWSEFTRLTHESPLYSGTIMPEGDSQEQIDMILTQAKYNESLARVVAPYRSFVGSPLPSVLLVGEKRGGEPPYVTESCFAPRKPNSGSWLLDSLPFETWANVALVNAVEEGDKLPQLLDDLADPPVIALGRAASDVLLDLGIDHGGVPHPSYAKRFHGKKAREYGVLLSDVMRTRDVKFSWPN